MKIRILFYTAVLFLIFDACFSYSSQQKSPESILNYLPTESTLKKWSPMGDPQTAEGENLFQLINGGAEIYHEYGFKRAVIHSYECESGLSLNIEIYEMEDSFSAYGVFSFKTGRQGRKVDIGMDAILEDYYLNFWKSNYVVTLIGFDTSQATQQALKEFAKIIEPKLPDGGEYPPLIHHFTAKETEAVRTVYMEGNLAIFNQYEFHTENIFGIKKGVSAYFPDHTLFILEYNGNSEARDWFQNAWKHLKQSEKFHGFEGSSGGAVFQDKNGNYIVATPFQKYILVYLGKNESKAKDSLKKLKISIVKNGNSHHSHISLWGEAKHPVPDRFFPASFSINRYLNTT